MKGFRGEPLGEADRLASFASLERFHLVLLVEHLGDPRLHRFLRRFLGLPDRDDSGHLLSVGHARGQGPAVALPTTTTTTTTTTTVVSHPTNVHVQRAPPPPEIVERLRADNWVDLRIYAEWKERADCALGRLPP